ncbi:murein L,D-transpeptidase family protein [Uliginosibacterium sp. TH139]|uniref:L,D-transpeptidase family protein n=1 Tax=Uliginosibacterium sp. TH139 TaxID=2067453 RepID=UPI0020B14D5D|nr:L,D-transpeptidase family protein [Uliginosibacterium sp. TH139]
MTRTLKHLFSSKLHRIAACAALIVSSAAWAPTGLYAGVSDAGPDATITLIIRDIEQNKLDVALARTENLLGLYPNFRLAHLIRGDLLLARTQPLATFGNAAGAPADKLRDLREEAIARLQGYRNRPAQNQVPRYLLQMREDQNHAVVVDTKQSRLYLYRNEKGRPVFVADWYISQGKAGAEKQREGDNKTPVGLYQVTSVMPPEKLTDFYGKRAFPLNYPNEWDKMQGRNGHGIWLHGVPRDTFARPPKASEGCVVLANQDLDALSTYLQIGVTPVIISNGIEWLSLDDWQNERSALNQAIDDWRRDWESRDVSRYLSHYSTRFKTNDQDFEAWARQKREVTAGKTWVKVELRNLSVLRNPGSQDEMVMVSFEQEYRSSNLNNVAKKRQYWRKENGRWKIIYEGVA